MQHFRWQVLDQTPTLVSCTDDHSVSTIKEVITRLGETYLNSCRGTDNHRTSVGNAECSPRDHTPDRQDFWSECKTERVVCRGCDGG